MRKLASIKIVGALSPIEGRDRIELASIDGWHVIVKKGEFRVGDKCVFMEIDSVLPEREEFEFLRSKNFRIKTMKMAGVISQGIVFPMNILPKRKRGEGEYETGDDVTKVLGIKQYEPTMDKDPESKNVKKFKYPKCLMRFAWFRKLVKRFARPKKELKKFPGFIAKTDETRIQNIPFILEDKQKWVATEKIDGQSGSFCLVRKKSWLPWLKDKFKYIVCSRNQTLGTKDNSSYWSVSDKYEIENALRNIIGTREWVAIQGECIAPKVQMNKYKVTDPDLYVFNLVYPDGRIDSCSAKKICEEQGLKFVPIITADYVLPDTVEEVLEYAHGRSAIGNTLREGIVFRSADGKQSFKAVDPLFLIKYDE